MRAIFLWSLAIFAAFVALGWQNPPPPPPRQGLAGATVEQCRALLALGRDTGMIRAAPSPRRIDVDDGKWAAASATTRKRTLEALACATFQTLDLAADQYVVAYGHRGGQRLAILTSGGINERQP